VPLRGDCKRNKCPCTASLYWKLSGGLNFGLYSCYVGACHHDTAEMGDIDSRYDDDDDDDDPQSGRRTPYMYQEPEVVF